MAKDKFSRETVEAAIIEKLQNDDNESALLLIAYQSGKQLKEFEAFGRINYLLGTLHKPPLTASEFIQLKLSLIEKSYIGKTSIGEIINP